MKKFLENDFLLGGETAKRLYDRAKTLPVIDYHSHVSAAEIAGDKRYGNITELWLGGDHYKWRAMRLCGIDEKYITGDASDYEKFFAFASAMPKLIGNPLYHWSHLELKRYFGYDGILSQKTAEEVWNLTRDRLEKNDMSVKGLIVSSGVEALCTTDDPCDDLSAHRAIRDSGYTVRVLPAFRPDKCMAAGSEGFAGYIGRLSSVSGTEIKSVSDLKNALISRMDYFSSLGCITADHGLDNGVFFSEEKKLFEIEKIFKNALSGDSVSYDEAEKFKTHMLGFFGKEYKKRGWVMQLHIGAKRNVNSVMFSSLGPDSGFDCMCKDTRIDKLPPLLDSLKKADALPKTILYSLNPADNAALCTVAASFFNPASDALPTVTQGSAWWFCDNEKGMREQLDTFATLMPLGTFIGMLTDSRSFISYTRHEYFRRILCDMLGSLADSGRIPYDEEMLLETVDNICYNNTKSFFGF